VTGTRTLTGTSQNVFTYTLNEDTKPANYNITTRLGTLTILNRDAKYEIEVEGISQTVTYNGREQTAEGLITTTFTVDGHVYTVEGLTASASGTDAGEYPMNVVGTPVVRDSEGNDVTSEFAIVTRNGTLTIAPKAVTITANDASRMYDGTALTEGGFTASALEAGDLHTFTVAMTDDSTITNAGTQPNVIRTVDGTAVTTGTETRVGNYLVTTADGTLEVTKRTVILTSGSSEKEYDGTPMTDGTVTEGGDGFVEGEGATYDVTGSQTDAGESKNTFTYTLNEGTNADNYEIITEEGTLRGLPNTTPITVTITEHGETLVYDGQMHTVTGYDVSSDNELYTEADFSFSGSAEVSGRLAGTYEMTLAAKDFANTNPNFTNVTFVIADGALVITPKPLTITGGDNGTYTVNGLNEGDTIVSVIVTPTVMEDGTIVNVPSGVVIRNADGEIVTASYNVNYVGGEQTMYRLTVYYWIGEIGGAQAADTFVALYSSGANYSVTSPVLAGYNVDNARVSGTITADTILNVVYTEEQYRLTIYYLFTNGAQAAETYEEDLAFGESYDVVSPALEGYNVNFREVSGQMPARNMTYTVRYWSDNETIIEDYETPLGIQNMSMSMGETYE
jgi:hypothetical protein